MVHLGEVKAVRNSGIGETIAVGFLTNMGNATEVGVSSTIGVRIVGHSPMVSILVPRQMAALDHQVTTKEIQGNESNKLQKCVVVVLNFCYILAYCLDQ